MTDYSLAHTVQNEHLLLLEEQNPPCQTSGPVNEGLAYCAWLSFTVHETVSSWKFVLCCNSITSVLFYNHLSFASKTETVYLGSCLEQSCNSPLSLPTERSVRSEAETGWSNRPLLSALIPSCRCVFKHQSCVVTPHSGQR